MSDADNNTGNGTSDENVETTKSEAEQKIETLQQELDKAKKDYLYLFAEFDNYKKQAIRDRSQFMKYANENVLRDIVQVMDNFNLALQSEITPENISSFVAGVKMISKEMQNTVEKYGVVKLQSLGEKFDPSIHEALGAEPTNEVKSGHISKVFKDGYKFHDRLLRPAQVIVASEKPDEQNS